MTGVLLACASLMLAAAQPSNTERRMAQGIEAYRNGRYAAAAEHFAAAVQLDPGYVDARLYLGTSLMAQYVPGSDDPGNAHLASRAVDEFQEVLNLDPEHELALSSIASIYYRQKKYDEAAEWYEKLTSLDPDNKEAWYTLGVIAWNRFYPAHEAARATAGLQPPDTGPLPDPGLRKDLKRRYSAIVAEGIEDLQKALSIDPAYDDAMAYLNLLLRQRADWADSPAEYQKEIAAADVWVQKAVEARKLKAARRQSQ
jgi:tetratricopeptide (TPR) repeat protein